MRSFATEAHDAQQLSVKEAIKSELEYEHDNHDPEAVTSSSPVSSDQTVYVSA